MKKIVVLMGVLIVFLTLVLFLVPADNNKPKKKDKLTIVTTLFPTYDFAKMVSADVAEVTLLLPPSVEPHSYEPKPSDIVKINQADLFVYTGEFMEPWAGDIISGLDKKVKVVDGSVGVELINIEEGEDGQDNHGEGREHTDEPDDHDRAGFDPHIWLDFDNAQKMAANIEEALVEIDQKNAKFYERNLKQYQAKLQALDGKYARVLSTCKTNKLIYAGHYAFGYLANRYGLDYQAVQGISGEGEPTAVDMIALVEEIADNDLKFIFYESLSSPRIARTLSEETDTQLLMLSPAANISKTDFEKGKTYISIMEDNLENLALGLRCESF